MRCAAVALLCGAAAAPAAGLRMQWCKDPGCNDCNELDVDDAKCYAAPAGGGSEAARCAGGETVRVSAYAQPGCAGAAVNATVPAEQCRRSPSPFKSSLPYYKYSCQPPSSDRVGVLMTHWGQPRGWSFHYIWQVAPRAMLGPREHLPSELACTDEFVGRHPYRWQIGLLPFSIMSPCEPLTSVYDGNTVLRRDGDRYVPMSPDLPPIPAAALVNETLIPVSQSVGGMQPLNTEAATLNLDPRDNKTDHLAEWFTVQKPNGVPDIMESVPLSMLRSLRMIGAPETSPEMDQQEPVAVAIVNTARQMVADDFTTDTGAVLVDFEEGGYMETQDPTGKHPENHYQTVDSGARKLADRGLRRMVIARETTDNNNYANEQQSGSYTRRSLCLHGYRGTDRDADNYVDTKAVKQTGRTPEYNEALMRTLGRQLRQPWIRRDQPVAVVYLSRGLPWGSPELESPEDEQGVTGIFASPNKHCQEIYPENVFLNFLSFKRRAQARYGKEFNLVFQRRSAPADSDMRMDNHVVYGTTSNTTTKDGGTNGMFKTWRTALNDIKTDGYTQSVTILSHWDYSWYESMSTIRERNGVPLSPTSLLQQRVYNHSWCEAGWGPVDCADAGAVARFSVSEAFDNTVAEFSTGYAAVIRGGVERFGVLPPRLHLSVAARGTMSRDAGGAVGPVAAGPLRGAALRVPADPHPGWPEAFNPDNTTQCNASLVTTDPADTWDAMWPDYDGEAFFLARVGAAAQFPAQAGVAVHSDIVYAGPYRAIFNQPVNVTVPLRAGAPSGVRPVVWNHVTAAWEDVLRPPAVRSTEPYFWAQTDNTGGDAVATLTFQTEILGMFAAAL